MPEKVKILKAVDNDTFKVQLKDGTTKSVRLVSGNNQAWYDGFEKGQPGFKLDEAVSSLVGKEVDINFRQLSGEQSKVNSSRELGSISTATIPDLAEHLYNKSQVYKRDTGKDWALNKTEVQKDSLISPQQFKAIQSILVKKESDLEPKKILAYKREIESAKKKFDFKTNQELVDFVKRRSNVPYESLETFKTQLPLTQSIMATPSSKTLKVNTNYYKDPSKQFKGRLSVEAANALIEEGKINGTSVEDLKNSISSLANPSDLVGFEHHVGGNNQYLYPVFKGETQQAFNTALKNNEGQVLTAFGNRYATGEDAIQKWKNQFGINADYTTPERDSIKPAVVSKETSKKKSSTLTYNAVGLPNRLDSGSSLSNLLKFDLSKNTEGTLEKWKGSKFDTIQPNSVQSIGGKKAIVSESTTDKSLLKDGYDYKSYFFEDGTYRGPDKIGRWKFNEQGVPEIYATKRNDSNEDQFSKDFQGALETGTNDALLGGAGFLGKVSPIGKYLTKLYDKIPSKIKLSKSKVTEKITPKDLRTEFKQGGILKFQNGQALPYVNIPGVNTSLQYKNNPFNTGYQNKPTIGNIQGNMYQYSSKPVYDLQKNLNTRFNAGLVQDGMWGPKTANAQSNAYTVNNTQNYPSGEPPIISEPRVPIRSAVAYNNVDSPDSYRAETWDNTPPKTKAPLRFGYQEANLALSVLPALLNTKVKADRLAYQPYNPMIRGIQGDPLLQQRLTSIAQNKYLQNKATSSDPTQELVRRLVVNKQAMQGNQEAYNVDTQARIADTQRYYGERNAANQYNYTNKQNTDNQNIQMNNNAMMQNAAQKNQVTGQTIQNIMGYMTNKANDQNLFRQNYLVHKNIENQGALDRVTSKYTALYNTALTPEQKSAITAQYNNELNQVHGQFSVNKLYSGQERQLGQYWKPTYKRGGTISDAVKVLSINTKKSTDTDKTFIDSARKYNELSSKVSTAALDRGSRLVVSALNNLPKTTLKSLPFKKLF